MNLSDSDDGSSSDSYIKESDEQDAAGETSNGMSYYRNNANNPKKRKFDSDEHDAGGETSNGISYYMNNPDHSKQPHLDYGDSNYNETSSHENIRLSRSSGNGSSAAEQDEQSELDDNTSDTNDDRPQTQDSPDDQNSDVETYGFGQQNGFGYSEPSVSDSNEHSEQVSVEGPAKDIGWRLMNKMGYKTGKGLGKLEVGRIEPVEASTQKGRRGLGLTPSKVGEVPKDFKWTPDDKVPEAKEVVSWIPPAPEEPLTRDQLEDWLEKVDSKKRTIDNETTFVDPQILHGVLNSKVIFDQLADEQQKDARFRSNPFETIGSVMFLNRAAVKMANLDAVFGWMFTKFLEHEMENSNNEERKKKKEEVLYFADVCAGPGGFSEYVLHRKRWKAKGFGFTLKGKCDFKLSNFFAGTPETFNPYYGVDDDGDIFKPGNLSSLKEKVLENTDDKGVHFLMADGGFSVEGNENIQEILSKQLYLCQCLAALMLVRTGGHFVVKLFDVFTKFSVSLIYVMYRCFDKVCIHKPVTSRPANSERYLVCKGKRLGTESVEQHLFTVNAWLWEHRASERDVASLVPLHEIEKDTEFFNYIYSSNCRIGKNQIGHLLKIAEYSKDSNLKDLHQNEMRTLCLKLWSLTDEMRKPPKISNIEETFKEVICKIKCKPPDYNNLTNVKLNILNKPPKLLLKSPEELKAFTNVLKWRFVFMGNQDKSKDIKFFLGNGGKQVYQLEGTRWKLSDINLTLPAHTLFYGEIVKEFNEGGKIFKKTVHMIDAVMLGGIDISNKPIEERHEQCSLFCIALDKPFDTTSVSLRCKKLYNLENFGSVMDKVDIQATKLDRNAVTVRVPSRHTNQHTFFAIRSILFIREVREPWDTAMSSLNRQKYYHKERTPSEYNIGPEMVNDMFRWYVTRILWEWEAPLAIYKNAQNIPLNRIQVEAYIEKHI